MRHNGLVVLAAAIMVIAHIGKDHRGALVPDAINYVSSMAASYAQGSQPQQAADLPNPTDMSQIQSYIAQKFQDGYSKGMGVNSSLTLQSLGQTNNSAANAGNVGGLPILTDLKQINQ